MNVQLKGNRTVLLLICLAVINAYAQSLNISGIRLVDGSGQYGGRVELNINGIWGTVCDDNFDLNDARVMCRMLNLQATGFVVGGQYGQGFGPIYAQRFHCNGYESSLSSCSFVPNTQCAHARDVGIICTECGEINYVNGRIDISADGKTAATTCREGLTAKYKEAVCVNRTWSVPTLACSSLNITDIRLRNGVGVTDGRVEILVNGTWGTICGTSFNAEECYAVCKMLGFPSCYTYWLSSNPYGAGTGPVYLSNLLCTYSDTDINDCAFDVTHTCTHSQDVAVACNTGKLNITDVRLSNGTGKYDGRVELFANGVWGTICHRDDYYYYLYGLGYAETICKMMNLSMSAVFTTPVYGPGSGPVFISYLICSNAYNHINSCGYSHPYYICNHGYDLTLACSRCGRPRNIVEQTIRINGTQLTANCFPGFSPSIITLTCREDGQWDTQCQQIHEYPLEVRQVYLADTYSTAWPSEGLVRILVNGTWGGICGSNFDARDAIVICRMMNLQYFSYSLNDPYRYNTEYGRDKVPIFVDNLTCFGNESHINECIYNTDNNCTYWNDVAVSCTGYQLNITHIRLSGTNSSYAGRVEVLINGTWGTVCQNYFSWNEADLVCRMLGFGNYYTYRYNAYYGPGTGPIYVDRLRCDSPYYSNFSQCKYATNNFYNCSHNADVAVVCYGPKLNITGARLVNGTGPNDGRAEILVDGVWGTICDQNFDILVADLFCQILYLRALKYYTGATNEPGTGPVYVEQIFCSTSDKKLSECKYLHLNTCSHDRDVSVVCSACGQPDLSSWDVDYFQYNGSELYADCSYYKTYVGILKMKCNNATGKWFVAGQCQEYRYPLVIEDIRLAGGSNASSGRVAIKSLGTWGTVCNDSFGMSEAETVCRMVGYPPAISFSTGLFGKGSGPIFVDDLHCDNTSFHINNCTYITRDNCQHIQDVSVTCTDCGSPVPTKGFANSTNSNAGSVVEVSCASGYRVEGDSVLTCHVSGKWLPSPPSCILIDCDDPTPDNGLRNTTETRNGTTVIISCKEGYDLIGNRFTVCQENDTWTSYPMCRIKDCGRPAAINSAVELPSNKTTYGEQAVISCIEGYSPDGSTTVTCLANATWEPWPSCKIVDCGDPTPTRGIANTTNTTYGAVVKVTCEPGFNITGSSIIVCQSDKTWSDIPKCDTSDCGSVQLANGDVEEINGTAIGALAYARCDPGYDLTGSPILLCTAYGWNDTLTCKKQDCGDPTPKNGKRTDSGGTLFGDTATIECDIGYKRTGNRVTTCQAGGNWSNVTSCSLKDCGSVITPPNGAINDLEGTKYGATLKFYCNSGFLLVGRSSIHCDSNGNWSHDPPQCIAKSGIGGSCRGDLYCLSQGAVCKNAVCTCLTEIHDNRTNTCDAMPLLPYGPKQQDQVVSRSSNCAKATKFTPGIPFFKKKHTDAFVCARGYITFDSLYTNPTPPKDRNSVQITLNTQTILAPFFGNIDVPTSGPVYYRTYDILNTYSRMKEDDALISYIEWIIKKFGNLKNFEASFVLIATWTDAKCISNDLFSSRKTATFQVVVVSDGRTTYAFNIYGQGQMQWADDSNLSNKHCEDVFIGYAVDQVTYTHPAAFSVQSLQLDIRVGTEVSSEFDVAGLVFKPMTTPGNTGNNHAIDCIKWYNDNEGDRNDLDYLASRMPECPCDIWLSRFDPWFWRIGLQRGRKDINYACVDMLPTGNFAQYGKSCCYDLRTWSWVYERPFAGGFELYHPDKYPAENFRLDVLPKVNCCVFSDHCNLFYKLRPTGSCYRSSPYNFGTFWGDPHFRTLDGLNFTFNGLGEFTMLQIRTENNTFDLQARTKRAVKQDGNLSDATVFSAFAAKDSSKASVHVELNKAKTGLNIFANREDVTIKYTSDTPESPFQFVSDNLYLAERDGALSVLFPFSGISLNILVNVGMLSLTTTVPHSLQNTAAEVRGLLGNYDDDPYNDFTLPNGTVLPANMSERQIFAYGMAWEISGPESAFVYEEGKNHSHFHNTSYVPRFLDEASAAQRRMAERVCNGSQNIECIFDYVFTENPEIAEATSSLREQVDSDKEQLVVTVPILTGCSTTWAVVGQNVTCAVKYNLNDNIKFVKNSAYAKFHKDTATITYYQKNDGAVDIQIISTNDKNRSSSVFQLSVVLCTGCSGHGNCTEEIREDNRSTRYFKYAVCQCDLQYEGIDCEKVFDGCAASPCSHGRNCTRLSAEEQKLLGRAYNCSACPKGYHDTGGTCRDIDECNGTIPCQHTCINTDGSYLCTCDPGFRVDPAKTNRCKDVNECEEAAHNCTHLCNNTVGGFRCTCYKGYQFNESSWRCVNNQDLPCNDVQRCVNTSGCMLDVDDKPICFCEEGFELDESGTSCKDVDECKRNVCPQMCNNTIGSFQCSCYAGYKLVGLTTCQECDVPFWGENCEKKCACTGRGANRCDRVKGCLCGSGWQGASCDEDTNECDVTSDSCADPRKRCVNTLGSYSCSCIEGYQQQANGSCEEVDECSSPILNNCHQTCSDTLAGFTCGCKQGFTKLNATHCRDIDECSVGIHRCEQLCGNYPGSYRCFCHFGYTLNDDRHTCEKQEDPCLTERNLTCTHYCVLEGSTANCRCYSGYSLNSDNQTCSDIDECRTGELNKCSQGANCTNIDGTYLCTCPVGRKLENDGRTCTDCDMFHYGVNCSQTCSCIHGTCDRINGCECDVGWAGDQCDKDIDECVLGSVSCTIANSVCINTPGSAKCTCRLGFVNISGICEDINECSDAQSNGCDQICINTQGSFRCDCHTGFILKDGKCTDINECSGSHGCTQQCENTVGNYRCSCLEGYRLNLTDRRTCRPEHECTNADACGENTSCTISSGLPVCTCVKGFQNTSTGCHDIDECSNRPKPCQQHCNNTEGSFICFCQPGFFLKDDKTTCLVCDDWKYGTNCTSECQCNRTNTEACDPVSGLCQCKKGWTGRACVEDIDDCQNNSTCPANSGCKNHVGGYNCICHIGYFISGSGFCEECDSRHFGENCSKTCQCDLQNTLDCNHINGSCICKQGWKGAGCTINVNECIELPGICQQKKYSDCVDTIGSYLCVCNDGFVETGGTCEACDRWTYGKGCLSKCSCITPNTDHCDKINGSCICVSGWNGTMCSSNINECEDTNICPKHSDCKDNLGSFTCVCVNGYTKFNYNCIATETSVVTSVTITIYYTLPVETNLNSSETYERLKSSIKASLEEFYKGFTKDTVDVVITDIRNTRGSVIVDYTLMIAKSPETAAQLISAAFALAGGVTLTIGGAIYTASAEQYKGLELCDIYNLVIGRCDGDRRCIEEDHKAYCRLMDKSETWPAIVGGTAGGICLIITAIVIIWCIRLKQTEKKKLRKERNTKEERLVKGTETHAGFRNIPNWKDGNESRAGTRYPSWRSMITGASMPLYGKNPVGRPYQIPRVRAEDVKHEKK